MIDGIQGSSSMHQWHVKYVQHDYYLHSQLLSGTKVVRHEKVEQIVTASPAAERSYSVRGQQVDIYA